MDACNSDLQDLWDVAIVGSGMGGATLASDLAARGYKVLLLEKGSQVQARPFGPEGETPEERLAQGWWPNLITARRADGSKERFILPVGCAVGGSTVHYAAALERMAASDFEGLQGGKRPVPPWPVRFAEFAPFYEAAEKLYGIRQVDSVEMRRRLSDWDVQFMQNLRRNGLNPELLNVAIRYDDACEECIGRVCPRRCKGDARSACIDAAMSFAGFRLVERCDVRKLEADASRVTSIVASHAGKDIEIRARIVVLAAGAVHTPQILLRSASDTWPQGVANSSNQVGRNLMFHTVDVFAIWARSRLSREGRQRKSLSIRDFYMHEGRRLGYVQSVGLEAGQGVIAGYLKNLLRRRGLQNEFLLKLLVALPARVAARIMGSSVIFAAMTEDDPDPENRLVLDPEEPDGITIVYAINDDLLARADSLRELFARHVAPWRFVRVSTALEMNYGHACGTCRSGLDPASSVLDRDCKAHDLDNLYIVDASFMPRSGAVNPSLTIAANAIRVAAAISERLRQGAEFRHNVDHQNM